MVQALTLVDIFDKVFFWYVIPFLCDLQQIDIKVTLIERISWWKPPP